MARIRTIKPEFWTSAQVLECSTNARLLFLGLWNFADDAGRHPDSEKQCKAEVFPADDFTLADVRGMLDELSENGLIVRYAVDGKGFFQITGWHHQRIDKPQSAKYPGIDQDDSKNDPGTLPPERKGKEGKGEEGKEEKAGSTPVSPPAAPDGDGRSARASPHTIPDDWTPNETNRRWMDEAGLSPAQQVEVIDEFRRWARNSGHRKANWDLAFSRNPAVKSAVGRAKTRQSSAPSVAASFEGKEYEGTPEEELPAWGRGG